MDEAEAAQGANEHVRQRGKPKPQLIARIVWALVRSIRAHGLANERCQTFRSLRKSTGFVATMILTAPVGPITTSPSVCGSLQHRLGFGAPADANRDAVDLKLDHAGISSGFPFPLLR
ncbi:MULTISPECIES: hypothetical protein [unclassified Mesorhizobium]|uniref:hypothetical protein n=1 Tax=unclassified Mesorhizobium TaxID=325217 RepID=UPI0016726E46|nr:MULTISPECIES: hypothetical protein [unclassified Mesorhizobium]